MRTISQILPLFFVGLSFAVVGWIVVAASRIERERHTSARSPR
jgi:hypothetical protein